MAYLSSYSSDHRPYHSSRSPRTNTLCYATITTLRRRLHINTRGYTKGNDNVIVYITHSLSHSANIIQHRHTEPNARRHNSEPSL